MVERAKQPIPPAVAAMIERATHLLVEAAHPEKIILFGSYARGDFDRESDLDFLVILPEVDDPVEIAARLRLVLTDVPRSIDIIALSEADVARRAHLRGTMLYHALREGVALHDTT